MAIADQGVLIARAAPQRGSQLRRLFVLLSALVLALTMAFAESTVVTANSNSSAPAKGSQAALVLKLLRNALGHPFRIGTEGPKYYDCSGLVWSVYKRAGLVGRIGGVRGTATHYFRWAQKHGLVSRRNPQIGDVVIWGTHGKVHHSGIYIGNGRAISALNRKLGVRNWPLRYIHMRIFGYIHTRISN